MQKALKIIIVLFIFCGTSFIEGNVIAEGKIPYMIVAQEKSDQGLLQIEYYIPKQQRAMLMVEKGEQRYYYHLDATKQSEKFPLQLGNGEYTISLLLHLEANRYRRLMSDKLNVSIKNEQDVFLHSVQNIKWDTSMQAIIKAHELTKHYDSEMEKINAIYDYITKKITYDNKKASSATRDYLPNIEEVYSSQLGICYDYSSLFAAMLRSIGIPTKLVTGYTEHVKSLHAWNEVYIESLNQWVIIDTTVDAQLIKKRAKAAMLKEESAYKAVNFY